MVINALRKNALQLSRYTIAIVRAYAHKLSVFFPSNRLCHIKESPFSPLIVAVFLCHFLSELNLSSTYAHLLQE